MASVPRFDTAEVSHRAGQLIASGKYPAAERLLRQALAAAPSDAGLLVAFGVLLAIRGQLPEAIKHLRRAVRSAPDDPSALFNLGLALTSLGRHEEAVNHLTHAARISDDAPIHEKLGDCLRHLGMLEPAATHFERAADLAPANSLALSSAVEVLRRLCRWERLPELQRRLVEAATRGDTVEPLLLMHIADDPLLQRKVAENYWRRMVAPVTAPKLSSPRRDAPKLRIGYLSGDFRRHPMVSVIAEVIELHDRRTFEITGFSTGPDDGSTQRRRMERAFDRFVDLGTASEAEIAARIAQAGIDILVDLAGYTANARLSAIAARPASIVSHYMGYPGTLGSPAYDYLIADAIVAPPGAEAGFSERLARLPHSYWGIDTKRSGTFPTTTRADHGLPDDAVVLSSFNGQQKLSPDLLDIWSRVLTAVPQSILWLYSDHPAAAANLRKEAAARDIPPQRLVMAGRVPPDEHLARIGLADLMFDATPYGGHTTACDALWRGVPVLTIRGKAFAARVGASLLSAVGMRELIAESTAAYEQMAIALASDRPRLAKLKQDLAAAAPCAALFDTPRFTRDLESAYRQMWSLKLRGAPPAHFDVGVEPPSPQ